MIFNSRVEFLIDFNFMRASRLGGALFVFYVNTGSSYAASISRAFFLFRHLDVELDFNIWYAFEDFAYFERVALESLIEY